VAESWKAVCKVKDISTTQVHRVQRGLAWQELAAVEVFCADDERVLARLEGGGAKYYTVRVEEGRVYLDLNELNAPASRAEAALGDAWSVIPRAV